jgi:hypothetical protein
MRACSAAAVVVRQPHLQSARKQLDEAETKEGTDIAIDR